MTTVPPQTEKASPATPSEAAANPFYCPVDSEWALKLLGGVPRGTVTGLVGPPGAAKSTGAFELGLGVCKADKKNLLVFDTETSIHTYDALLSGMEERFGVPLNLVRVSAEVENKGSKTAPNWVGDFSLEGETEKGALNVFVVHQPDITPILVLHGRGADVDISAESGKVKITLMKGSWASQIGDAHFAKFVKKHNVGCIIYDSITNPLDEFPAVTENFPARSDLTQLWMIQAQKLAASMNIPILATIHESKNDASPFNPGLKMEGGKGVGYNLKFVVYFMKEKNKAYLPRGSTLDPPSLPEDGRHLFNMRHPREAPWARYVSVKLTRQGLVPLTQAGA